MPPTCQPSILANSTRWPQTVLLPASLGPVMMNNIATSLFFAAGQVDQFHYYSP
jgi:hypothetical protein